MHGLPGIRGILKSLEGRSHGDHPEHGLTADPDAQATPASAELDRTPGAGALPVVSRPDRVARPEEAASGGQIPERLDRALGDEGYTLAMADASGLAHVAGKRDWSTGPDDVAEVCREIQALEGTLEPGMPPVEIMPQEHSGRKITVYPGAAGDEETRCLVVIRRLPEDADARSRREWLNLLGRFTSSIAHEIKNPLTGIAAGVQYLAKRLLPGAAEADTVDFILAEIARLNRIVDDLYKIARPPQLVLARTSINSVVTRSLFCLSDEIVRKRLRVEESIDGDVPAFDADPERLQQVVINVIKNAIEASQEGGTIEIATSAGDGRVQVKVTDCGPGIPPEARARIFEPFYSTKKGGTGLGLCISQAIVEEHGGRITIESPLRGGTRFVIELPSSAPRGV